MAAVRTIKEGMTYNPDTGSYSVRDVAGNFIGDTTQPAVAEHWHLYASGSRSRGRDATPTRAELASVPAPTVRTVTKPGQEARDGHESLSGGHRLAAEPGRRDMVGRAHADGRSARLRHSE